MTITVAIPILITLVAFCWARNSVRSHGMGAMVELVICGGAAAILSLGAWLVWALAMWAGA